MEIWRLMIRVDAIFVVMVCSLVIVGCGTAPTETAAENEAAAEPTATPLPPTAPPEPEADAATDTPSPTELPEPATATPLPPTEPAPESAEAADVPADDSSTDGSSTDGGDVLTAGNPDLDYAQVVYVKATQSSDGTWRFDTTVRHNDQGWDDYADAWQVIHPDSGEILGERILLHPHDNEQPFTRSQSGIAIPPEVTQVIVRAKDNVEGFGGEVVLVDLTVEQGEKFEVVRP